MSNRLFPALWIIPTLVLGCGPGRPAAGPPSGPPDPPEEILTQLKATPAYWNSGDLDRFVAPYDSAATFMTGTGPIGREEMRAHYRSKYFASGHPDQQLGFEQLTVRSLGADYALVTGRFVLSGGGKPELSGWFSLVWHRTPEGWKILHDHSS